MNEKTYKIMNNIGGGNIVLGIILLVTGLASGILLIVNGSKLMRHKSEITF